jgi:hypothetical protein
MDAGNPTEMKVARKYMSVTMVMIRIATLSLVLISVKVAIGSACSP